MLKKTLLSGKRGSNPRPAAWEAAALPTELLPHYFAVAILYLQRYKLFRIYANLKHCNVNNRFLRMFVLLVVWEYDLQMKCI